MQGIESSLAKQPAALSLPSGHLEAIRSRATPVAKGLIETAATKEALRTNRSASDMKRAVKPQRVEIESSDAVSLLRSHWLTNLIHDLSSPLFAARGYARMAIAEQGEPLTARQRRCLNAIIENLDRMVDATREFNDFLLEDRLEFESFSLRSLLDEAAAEIALELPGKNLLIHDSDSALTLIGDREKLTAAVCNFLKGAVQFTGDMGSVEISARGESGKILLEFSATRLRADSQNRLPDLSDACKLWRLHGGRVYVSQLSDEAFMIGCELPLLRTAGCLGGEYADEGTSDDMGGGR